jgi:hypothetical protein
MVLRDKGNRTTQEGAEQCVERWLEDGQQVRPEETGEADTACNSFEADWD